MNNSEYSCSLKFVIGSAGGAKKIEAGPKREFKSPEPPWIRYEGMDMSVACPVPLHRFDPGAATGQNQPHSGSTHDIVGIIFTVNTHSVITTQGK
jgi:hypothetical protein